MWWNCRQICSKCVMLSSQHGLKRMPQRIKTVLKGGGLNCLWILDSLSVHPLMLFCFSVFKTTSFSLADCLYLASPWKDMTSNWDKTEPRVRKTIRNWVLTVVWSFWLQDYLYLCLTTRSCLYWKCTTWTGYMRQKMMKSTIGPL